MNTQAQLNIYKACRDATKDRPVKRSELMALTGMTDRMVRVEIGKLRNEGNRICSTNRTKGYWLAKTDKEYIDFVPQYISRAKTEFKTLAAMDRQAFGQMDWFGLKNV